MCHRSSNCIKSNSLKNAPSVAKADGQAACASDQSNTPATSESRSVALSIVICRHLEQSLQKETIGLFKSATHSVRRAPGDAQYHTVGSLARRYLTSAVSSSVCKHKCLWERPQQPSETSADLVMCINTIPCVHLRTEKNRRSRQRQHRHRSSVDLVPQYYHKSLTQCLSQCPLRFLLSQLRSHPAQGKNEERAQNTGGQRSPSEVDPTVV